MAEKRSYIMGAPPEGGIFRLVRENDYTSFVGMFTLGLKDEGTEHEEEVNLLPGVGTKVVFTKKPELLLADGKTVVLNEREAVLCKLESGHQKTDIALIFRHGAFPLNWFAPEQEVRMYREKLRHSSNPYYQFPLGSTHGSN